VWFGGSCLSWPMVTLQATVADFQSNLWGHHLPILGELVQELISDGSRRVLCTINDKYTFPCALMPQHGDYFILLGKEVRAKLGLRLSQQVKVVLEKDTSEYGMPMPEEFSEVMSQDESGSRWFNELTPGKQRALIHLVGKVKNPDSRIRKALAIMQHLNEVGGKLDFKQLNQTIKHYNSL
jgi:hypothetical protein